MTRRPPADADADEDTLIMRRLRVDSASGKRRPALSSPATWLGLAMLAILLAGVAAWTWRGVEPPAVQSVVAAAPAAPQQPPAPQPAPAAQQAAAAPQQALLPQQPPAPHITDARLAEIDGLRHSGAAVYRLVENPRILLIDFPTLAEQGRAMNRLAALIEKSGMPHDRVLTEPEMALAVPNPDTYYLAHDYAATSLARFFSLAETETQPLNQQERDLLALLVGAHVIERAGAGYAATTPEMAVVTLVQADSPGVPADEVVDASLRDTMLHHEVSHGEFFTNPAYRAHCERFWRERMSEAERALFRSFLAGNGYDPANETLMINEMQAYLMHTPDPRAFSAALLHITPEKLAELRRRFMDPQPPTPLLGGKAPAGG
jgi:hypothetical protein